MTHTPGPWTIQAEARRNGRWIKSRDGQDIAQILLTKDTSEASANARLIAAAPDLLAALERLESAADTFHADIQIKLALKQARAAIVKAKETA